jgi:hypothetical protein
MWPLIGVLAAILIVVGIALLVVYAMRRGFVDRELPDTIDPTTVPTAGAAAVAEPPHRPRTLGSIGALILIAGLALGLAAFASGGFGSGTATTGKDCAQSWNGCPQVTAPAATPLSSLPNP